MSPQTSDFTAHHHSFHLLYGICMRPLSNLATERTTFVKGGTIGFSAWLAIIILLSGELPSGSSMKKFIYMRIKLSTKYEIVVNKTVSFFPFLFSCFFFPVSFFILANIVCFFSVSFFSCLFLFVDRNCTLSLCRYMDCIYEN